MVPEKLSEGAEFMTALAAEMRDALATIAGPRSFHDTRGSWLAKAARTAGISYRQAKAFWYGEVRNPRAEDVEKIRAALKARIPQEHEPGQLYGRVQQLEAELDELRRQINLLRANPRRPPVSVAGSSHGDRQPQP